MTEPTDSQSATSDTRAQERREALDQFWKIVKRLPAYGRLISALIRDRRVPGRARAFLGIGGLYLVSPLDLVPGIIPVIGQIDDVYVVLMSVRQALRTLPEDVADDYTARYGLSAATIDDDLAVIRRLVRIGVSDGARWSWRRMKDLRRKVMSP